MQLQMGRGLGVRGPFLTGMRQWNGLLVYQIMINIA